MRSSDIGISMMRARFFRELGDAGGGEEPGGIIRSANEAACIALPNMAREFNTEGIPLADYNNDPILRQRLKEFRHHFGQPAASAPRVCRGHGDRRPVGTAFGNHFCE